MHSSVRKLPPRTAASCEIPHGSVCSRQSDRRSVPDPIHAIVAGASRHQIVANPELAQRFPLALISRRRRHQFLNSSFVNVASLRPRRENRRWNSR